jgi:predicted anti-sigma-YlaC factor YlaD
MDCVEFEVLLFHQLDRELTAPDGERMQAHLLICADCRALYSLVRGNDPQSVTELPQDFATSVLASTSGSPCDRAQLLLAASEDGASDDDWLVERHLDNCPDCSAAARAMARLRLDLPTLAEADPGERFVLAVMAATIGVPRRAAGSRKSGLHWFIGQIVRRPRIALEGAYAIAMLLLMVFGLTSPTFSDLPARVTRDASRSVADTAGTVAAGVTELKADAVELGATVSSSSREFARTAWDGLIAPNVQQVRSLWNEKVSGTVEPDTSNPANR